MVSVFAPKSPKFGDGENDARDDAAKLSIVLAVQMIQHGLDRDAHGFDLLRAQTCIGRETAPLLEGREHGIVSQSPALADYFDHISRIRRRLMMLNHIGDASAMGHCEWPPPLSPLLSEFQ
jgi:hypothetical protein